MGSTLSPAALLLMRRVAPESAAKLEIVPAETPKPPTGVRILPTVGNDHVRMIAIDTNGDALLEIKVAARLYSPEWATRMERWLAQNDPAFHARLRVVK